MIDQPDNSQISTEQLAQLAEQIDLWASELGFAQCGIVQPDLELAHRQLEQWLEKSYQGEMDYLANHRELRKAPLEIHPGSCRIISVRMNYQPEASDAQAILDNPDKGYIARYTLGRDYHKTLRKRLTELGKRIAIAAQQIDYRAFVDSAPIMERPIAEQAGLGWTGKHTLIINRHAGSYFFLGELFINLPLPLNSKRAKPHCGRCTACLDICPTQAFPEPYVLDARRCISYLTIEKKGAIPEELRPLIGNRIFGCDDCQIVCPWNRFAQTSTEQDFQPRHQLDNRDLVELFNWSEQEFLKNTEGSAIRRTGYQGWLRNIAVALGNSSGGDSVIAALEEKLPECSEVVQEHIHWALERLSTQQTQ